MNGKFELAMAFTRPEEKGLVNDPDDPGGRTYDGIAEHANPEIWRDGVCTEEELLGAYRSRWDAIRGDQLPPLVALALFDWYFQSGAHAVRALQRMVGAVPDGQLGMKTLGALFAAPIDARRDSAMALELIVEHRARFLFDWINALPVKPDGKGGLRPARIRFSVGFARRLARLAYRVRSI